MIKSTKLILVRHAPVEKVTGYIPQNNPNAVVNLDHIKKLSSSVLSKFSNKINFFVKISFFFIFLIFR